jgi:hypothetical protein
MTAVTKALARTRLLVQRDIYPNASDTEVIDALVGIRVRLSADSVNLASPAGRTALVGAFVLIAELGCEIWLDVPSMDVIDQPPLRLGDLRTALLELGRDLITPARIGVNQPADLGIVLGDTVIRVEDRRTLRISGDDFSAHLTDEHSAAPPWVGTFPFGALLAASAAAAEAFKEAMHELGAHRGEAPLVAHALPHPQPFVLALPPLEPVGGAIPLGAIDVVSAGAITSGALFTLMRLPEARGALRVFDDDRLARSNLNRYPLARANQISELKVHALERLSTDHLRITGYAHRLDEASAQRIGLLSDRVIVGVDHVPSRWVAQRHAPGWVTVGATSHFEILVSGHPAGQPCAGCLHPRDDDDAGDIPTVSFVSALAGVLLAYRVTARSLAAEDRSSTSTLAAPLNLAGKHPFVTLPVAAHPDCPVAHSAGVATAA